MSRLLLLLLTAVCVAADPEYVSAINQPPNVGRARLVAKSYYDSGQYARDVAVVAAKATEWVKAHAANVQKPALVLDIDETALSNWKILTLDDLGRPITGPCEPSLDAPCGWAAWDQLGLDPAIAPTLDLFRQAAALKVTVFFITGRPESQREATERNLKNAGYTDYQKLYMVPKGARFKSASDFKGPVRQTIEKEGFRIIANVGDQISDLEGGHADQRFLLPDPFYFVP